MRLFPALLGVIAGAGLCVVIINRVLGHPGLQNKKPLIPPLSLLTVGGMGLYGFFKGSSIFILFQVVIIIGLIALKMGHLLYRHQNRGEPPIHRDGARFSLLRPITTTDLVVKRYEIRVSGWKGGRLRIAHLSDLHVNDQISNEYYKVTIQKINQALPDLIFFTGDFITDKRCSKLLPELLQGFRARLGTYAIFGNHDYWSDPNELAHIAKSANIQLINNGWRYIQLDPLNDILIQGCEDPWSEDRWQVQQTKNGQLNLALAHTADNIYRLNEAGVQVVFSGHYHAGQIQVPGYGPIIVPSIYGHRFYKGHYLVNGTHLFVSAGVGAAAPPIRIYCQPDILIVDIYAENN
jgi:predicted MPP superfamily phosphohydrolase